MASTPKKKPTVAVKPVVKKPVAPVAKTLPKDAETTAEVQTPKEGRTTIGGYVILSSHEIPKRTRASSNYPFHSLDVGEGFAVKAGLGDRVFKDESERYKAIKDEKRVIGNRLTGAIRRFKKSSGLDYQKFTVVTSSTDDSVYVERTE